METDLTILILSPGEEESLYKFTTILFLTGLMVMYVTRLVRNQRQEPWLLLIQRAGLLG